MVATLRGLCAGALHILYATPWYLAMILGSIFIFAAIFLLERFVTGAPYPPDIPLIREPPGTRRFSWRTRLAYYTDCRALFEEAWNEYLKHGKPVVLPGIGVRIEVILPPAYMRWALSQPQDHLNSQEALAEIDQAAWSLGHSGPVLDSWQGMLVKTELNRVLETVCVALDHELIVAFDKHFGTDTENWREVDLRETVAKAVAQASARFTVGLPLCRNQSYLDNTLQINELLIATAGMLSALPSFLRPIFGTPMGWLVGSKINRMKKLLVPLWQERISLARAAEQDNIELPQDHIQIMAGYALRERPEEVEDHDLIVRRICALNFGATHQTVIQAANLLLNIISSDPEFDTVATLRDESNRVLGGSLAEDLDEKNDFISNGDATKRRWTKSRVGRMVLADSASRETLRLHSFSNRACMRKVMRPGVTTPDGHTIPKGTMISFLTWPLQTDPDIHPDPLKFDPFRFAGNAGSTTPTPDSSPEGRKPQSFVTTSSDFLPFGHGKHSCPGRFLLDFELKMIISHVLHHYDVRLPDEYNGQRPPNKWMTEATFPPEGVKVCVRRREKSDIGL